MEALNDALNDMFARHAPGGTIVAQYQWLGFIQGLKDNGFITGIEEELLLREGTPRLGLGNPGISCDDVLDFILRAVAPDHGLSNASVQQLVDAVSSQLKQAAALLVGTTSTASAYADATAAELQEGASNRHETAAADAQLQEAQKQVAQAAYSCQQLADAQARDLWDIASQFMVAAPLQQGEEAAEGSLSEYVASVEGKMIGSSRRRVLKEVQLRQQHNSQDISDCLTLLSEGSIRVSLPSDASLTDVVPLSYLHHCSARSPSLPMGLVAKAADIIGLARGATRQLGGSEAAPSASVLPPMTPCYVYASTSEDDPEATGGTVPALAFPPMTPDMPHGIRNAIAAEVGSLQKLRAYAWFPPYLGTHKRPPPTDSTPQPANTATLSATTRKPRALEHLIVGAVVGIRMRDVLQCLQLPTASGPVLPETRPLFRYILKHTMLALVAIEEAGCCLAAPLTCDNLWLCPRHWWQTAALQATYAGSGGMCLMVGDAVWGTSRHAAHVNQSHLMESFLGIMDEMIGVSARTSPFTEFGRETKEEEMVDNRAEAGFPSTPGSATCNFSPSEAERGIDVVVGTTAVVSCVTMARSSGGNSTLRQIDALLMDEDASVYRTMTASIVAGAGSDLSEEYLADESSVEIQKLSIQRTDAGVSCHLQLRCLKAGVYSIVVHGEDSAVPASTLSADEAQRLHILGSLSLCVHPPHVSPVLSAIRAEIRRDLQRHRVKAAEEEEQLSRGEATARAAARRPPFALQRLLRHPYFLQETTQREALADLQRLCWQRLVPAA